MSHRWKLQFLNNVYTLKVLLILQISKIISSIWFFRVYPAAAGWGYLIYSMKGAKQREWEPAISFTWCEALRKWKSPALPTFPRTAARRGIVFFEWAFVPDMARHWRANSCPDIKAPIMGYPESRLPTAEHRAPNPQFRQGVWKWGANKDLTSAHLSLAWFFGEELRGIPGESHVQGADKSLTKMSDQGVSGFPADWAEWGPAWSRCMAILWSPGTWDTNCVAAIKFQKF